MRKPIWEKRIPTLAALIVLGLSVWLTSAFLQNSTNFVGKASPNTVPQHVTISDKTDSSFTVSFITNDPVVAGLKVSGPTITDTVFFQDNQQEERYTHRITIPNLSPNTTYHFEILMEGKVFQDNGQAYTITTGPPLASEKQSETFSGAVLQTDGSAAVGALVILSGDEVSPLSTITNTEGVFSFDLASLRSRSLADFPTFSDSTLFTISAFYRDQVSEAKIAYQNLANTPPLMLSEQYDFSVLSQQEPASSDARFVLPSPVSSSQELRITAPAHGESTTDTRPTIRGTAVPGNDILLNLSPSRIAETIVADANGRWQYRPTQSLSPGEITITAQSSDAFGVTRSIQSTFIILSSGSQIMESATPSATLTPTLTPTATVTPTSIPTTTVSPTPTLDPTVTTTLTPSPTASITAAPTITITPIPTNVITQPPTSAPIPTKSPQVGSVSTIIISAASAILIFTGAALLFILS